LIRRGGFGGADRGDDAITAASNAFGGRHFELLHVFRLAMLPFARTYMARVAPSTKRHLDLDDIESVTRRRLAELYRAHGRATLANFEAEAARRAASLEDEVSRDFDRLYVCSDRDQAALLRAARAQVCVLPNALPMPDPVPPPPPGRPFTLLFIGTLGYYPNEEGIIYFCTPVFPLIRQAARPRDIRVLVVGPGASRAIQEVARAPDVTLMGAVPDVRAPYRESNAVMVPIRAVVAVARGSARDGSIPESAQGLPSPFGG